MDTMMGLMAMKASFGGVNRPIGNENRRGWWPRDGQGTKMSGFCNIGKNRLPRENLHISAIGDFSIGVSEDYDDHHRNGLGMVNSDGDDHDEKTISGENLDHWLHSSLPEIVKNVGEDPLLVHIYKENGSQHSKLSSSSSTTKMKYVMEKVTSESWMNITQRWENTCYTNIPYGIIFVEELSAKQPLINSHNNLHLKSYNNYSHYNNDINDNDINYDNKGLMMEYSSSHGTKMWGVLVQGKGINITPSCYLLKTCKVNCCFGSTTHFCLAKVENNFFGNSVDFHLNKFWLQR